MWRRGKIKEEDDVQEKGEAEIKLGILHNDGLLNACCYSTKTMQM